MRGKIPDYYSEFACIGSRCRNNCCIGWEIDIDPDSLKWYMAAAGDFGDRLAQGISMEDVPHFRTDHDGRCVFLNQENLCDIYIQMGEDALCDICTQHPRFHHDCGGIRESGLGIACEEAGRLILDRQSPVIFMEDGPFSSDETVDFLLNVREQVFHLLQNRGISMKERFNMALAYGRQAQDLMNTDCLEIAELNSMRNEDLLEKLSAPQEREFWLAFFQDLDIMDDRWRICLEKASRCSENNLNFEDTFWEQLMIYFVFRHLTAASDDYNIYGKIRFCVLSCLIIRWILNAVTNEKHAMTQMDIAGLYSREIEYSEENLHAVWDELLFDS